MPSWPYISLEEVKGTEDEFKFKAGMFEGIWTNLMVSCTLYSLQKIFRHAEYESARRDLNFFMGKELELLVFLLLPY